MIKFTCPSCATTYTVDDSKAGKRTTCPKCKSRLTVPGISEPARPPEPAPARRPPKIAVLPLIAFVSVFTGVAALAVWLFRPNPQEYQVVESLRERLPPGYENLRVEAYDREKGDLKFTLKYRDYGDILGVRYEVSRSYATGKGWRVQVVGRRRPLGMPNEWVVVEVVFDKSGKLVDKQGASAAGPGEGPILEERARNIATAVNDTF